MRSGANQMCMMAPYILGTRVLSASPGGEPLHDRCGFVAEPAGRPWRGPGLFLSIDPQLRGRHHSVYVGNSGGASAAGHQADSIHAIDASDPAEGEGTAEEI